jgi:hypothetical protein
MKSRGIWYVFARGLAQYDRKIKDDNRKIRNTVVGPAS